MIPILKTESDDTSTHDGLLPLGIYDVDPYRPTYSNLGTEVRERYLNSATRAPHDGGVAFAESAFPSLSNEIETFLGVTPLRRLGRWKGIPQNCQLEKALYIPLINIINTIIDYFKIPSRRSLITSQVYLPHGDNLNRKYRNRQTKLRKLEEESHKVIKSFPDIMTQAKGPGRSCFPSEDYHDEASYADCASPIEVKLDENRAYDDHLKQVAAYAQQSFIQQENRRHVYSAVVTQTTIQLFQFNRTKVVRSDRINFHERPKVFVQLILGLVSSDESVLGFDTSIFYEGSGADRARKIRLLIDQPSGKLDYRYVKIVQNRWATFAITGRGTTCWSVVVKKTRKARLVKDYWMGKGGTPEWEFLLKVQEHSVPGVVQMISYEMFGTALTDDSFRGVFFSDEDLELDRTWCRITFEHYGPPLESAPSILFLLCAFRDAVLGHWGLWKIGILHRDVSLNNVLLGWEFSRDGNCGVLIDLDHAIWIHEAPTNVNGPRIGTQAYQSIKVLLGEGYPHDYLDDLESFAYLLAWICGCLDGPENPLPETPKILEECRQENPEDCGHAKLTLVSAFDWILLPNVSDKWGQPVKSLLQNLMAFVEENFTHDRRRQYQGDAKTVAELHPNAGEKYAQFVSYINAAIDEVAEEEIAKNKQDSTFNSVTNVGPGPTSQQSAPTAESLAGDHSGILSSPRLGTQEPQTTNAVASPVVLGPSRSAEAFLGKETREKRRSLPEHNPAAEAQPATSKRRRLSSASPPSPTSLVVANLGSEQTDVQS
ncbi:hypothetical protein BDN72DRAFT_803210 [Pluteus cervinus]|uniref:Uncharacterized protein n=1 Tax=Pluteus cervinus TaxID=181527 RepID=A0ACD3ACN5_9AGAR|nr:hypothetical protein BDN72DRAFT_803210 [Pluteus cervinus]